MAVSEKIHYTVSFVNETTGSAWTAILGYAAHEEIARDYAKRVILGGRKIGNNIRCTRITRCAN